MKTYYSETLNREVTISDDTDTALLDRLESEIASANGTKNLHNLTSAFYRDAWLLAESKAHNELDEAAFDEAVRELATDYGLSSGFVWDVLPEIYALDGEG